MSDEARLYETHKYRCLVYTQNLTDDIYLMLCGIEHCLPDYSFHTEDRPGYHLHIILKGSGVLSVNGREQRLHFGQMFVTKPGEKTWYKADNSDPWVYCWMTFGGNIAKDCLEKAGFSDGVNNLNCNVSQQRFHSLVERVLDEAKLKPSNIYFRTGMLLEYISAAIDSNYMSGEKNRRPAEYHSDLYVDYAVNMIQENYASITISEVAKNIGIHRSYLTGIFKKKVGVSPQEFLLQCRIRQACKLLTETNNPIQEIARQVGYDNPLTFSNTFKTFRGLSPRSYREHKAKTE